MKKAVDIKYQHSANLFQFCRRVLDHKFGGIRVIDQDVGQILGFDPADCSHWKKGKKNIRSIQAMKSIAEHLGVDEKLVVDVASGEINETEAFCEFAGYGAFDIDTKIMESAKKDFYRKNASSWTKEKEIEFKTQFDANEPLIEKVVNQIHEKINFQEAPLYLPEIIGSVPEIKLTPLDEMPENAVDQVLAESANGITNVKYQSGTEMKAFMRYSIARAMAPHFLEKFEPEVAGELSEHRAHVRQVQANIFAAKLLTPARLIKKELNQINVSKDIVSQLAETFWVSKTFMNRRLKEILQGSLDI